MPWTSQNVFKSGEIIDIKTYLDTHHNGHMEIRACPLGDSSTLDCMNTPGNELIFVEDISFVEDKAAGRYLMPPDPNYPERGYYSMGEAGGVKAFHMKFKIPDHIAGDQVLLQWVRTMHACLPCVTRMWK